jgi:hypothetical protein
VKITQRIPPTQSAPRIASSGDGWFMTICTKYELTPDGGQTIGGRNLRGILAQSHRSEIEEIVMRQTTSGSGSPRAATTVFKAYSNDRRYCNTGRHCRSSLE